MQDLWLVRAVLPYTISCYSLQSSGGGGSAHMADCATLVNIVTVIMEGVVWFADFSAIGSTNSGVVPFMKFMRK